MQKFRTKPVEVEAVQLTEPCTLGTQSGAVGDYLVISTQKIVPAGEFEAEFEPVPQRGRPRAAGMKKGKTKQGQTAAAAA